ncbi:lysis system i-spanin subunit Rz [Arsenophonus endosymbiont of Aleurodicus floccissimus]|uniref:lysis system i-spanin subunit Rz n=1 Tax=Arsenophonus endosymbiont of Aleurodicus floccissimus TaxID=2152761 RepID=UPI000E6B2064|nr:lysis system i-spanin subunit Rz [Arsenophonus endosymbiont of Aleurodicus floccissimus]
MDELDKQTELKNSYLKEVKLLHQLDTKRKRTQELNHAKADISKLTDDLHNGTKRLYVKARCVQRPTVLPPPPPAWMMQDPPNWRLTLGEIISVSDANLKP